MSCEAAGPARNLKLEAEEEGGGRRREELRPSATAFDKTNVAPSAQKGGGGFREEQAEGKVEGEGRVAEKGRGRHEEMLAVTAAALP